MKNVIKILFLLLIPGGLSGQVTHVTNQYILNPLTINPGYAGNKGALNIAAFYRRQWVGIAGAPETMTLAIDAPFLASRFGLGFIVTSDKIGVTKETGFKSSYAYKISMGKGNLSLGLGAGILITNTNWSDLTVYDPGDEFFLTNPRVYVVPDFSFGVYYSCRNYFVGISIPELLDHSFNFNRDKFTTKFNPDQYSYFINSGYIISLSQNIKFSPSTLVTISPGESIHYDINGHFILDDRFWLGASYRNNRSVAGLLQFALNNQFRIGYTYDFDFNELRRYSNGSHEIMLSYVFRYKVNVVNPLIF